MRFLVENQTAIRIFFSFGGLLLFWGLALLIPYRSGKELLNKKRLLTNLTLNFGNGALVALVVPITLIQISTSTQLAKFSIFSLPTQNFWVQLTFGVVLLDLVIYWQHRLTHEIPLLWRMHRVHHSDIEFDTTTAGRFHTLEIFFSFGVKAFFVVLFGLNAESIIIFEIILNFTAMFNHSNFTFPTKIEKTLRYFLITPSLHRIHHSTHHEEFNRNYGFSVPFWDRIFSSFLNKNKENQKDMLIGLKKFRSKEEQNFFEYKKQCEYRRFIGSHFLND